MKNSRKKKNSKPKWRAAGILKHKPIRRGGGEVSPDDHAVRLRFEQTKLLCNLNKALHGNYGSNIGADPRNKAEWDRRWADIVYSNRKNAQEGKVYSCF